MNEPLEERVRSPGFTPRARDADALFALLATSDDDLAKDTERALCRLGMPAAVQAMTRFSTAEPPIRGRLCAVVGRVAVDVGDAALTEWLMARVSDADSKTRRRAVRDLGKLTDPRIEAALVSAFGDDIATPDARVFALSLGNVGSERALARLRRVVSEDVELRRVVREAITKIERGVVRRDPGALDGSRSPTRPTPVLLHVRSGLEEILQEELGARRTRSAGRGRVEVTLTGPLEALFQARTFIDIGFPLPPEPVDGGDVAAAVVRAVTSDAATQIFTAFTVGPIRYRIEWSSGRRRGATFRVAGEVAAARPELVNDPVSPLWQVVVTDRSTDAARVIVELWPHALVDPRFAYRRRVLPASSHPTVAAALARVAGVVPTDVVWDPFVGSGVELIERAKLGAYARLFGTDTDKTALEAARENVRTAAVERCELILGDARTAKLPEAPTLVLTNPPFGKRVLDANAIRPLLEATIERAAKLLRPGGRFVWLSPLPEVTARAARQHGFGVKLRREVDLGGLRAELQAFVL